MINRQSIAALSLSAAALIGLVVSEGYSDKAVIPVPGDKPTIGFGTTGGVRLGDTTTPIRALQRVLVDVQTYEGAIKQCIKVPLYQNEYDAYLQLAYNIGTNAFCGSTLVKKANAGDYPGACKEILRWDRFQGQPLAGLTKRRQAEYKQCMGDA